MSRESILNAHKSQNHEQHQSPSSLMVASFVDIFVSIALCFPRLSFIFCIVHFFPCVFFSLHQTKPNWGARNRSLCSCWFDFPRLNGIDSIGVWRRPQCVNRVADAKPGDQATTLDMGGPLRGVVRKLTPVARAAAALLGDTAACVFLCMI